MLSSWKTGQFELEMRGRTRARLGHQLVCRPGGRATFGSHQEGSGQSLCDAVGSVPEIRPRTAQATLGPWAGLGRGQGRWWVLGPQ